MTPPATVNRESELAHCTQMTPTRPSAVGLLSAMTSSIFVWIFIWLAVVDFSIVSFKPLKHVGMGGYIQADKNPLRIKLEKFLAPDCNPEVCIIGSSLAMSALSCADALVYNKPFPTVGCGLHNYYQCNYLEDKLFGLTGKKHKVFNVSVSGCMASDAWAILNKCLDAKPSIKIVVIMMSPRDIHDNAASRNATKSSVIEHLKTRFEPIDWQSIFTSQSALEHALSKGWQYFYQRSDYRTLLRKLSCETFDRSADAQSAAYGYKLQKQHRLTFNQQLPSANEVLPDEIKRKDAIVVERRFNPYDQQLLLNQFEYLDRTLKLCRSKNVVPIVVDLPVPANTLNFMPGQLKQDYTQILNSLCSKEATNIVELQASNEFDQNDFRDSMHPVGTGGKKIIDALAESLSHDSAALTQLNH